MQGMLHPAMSTRLLRVLFPLLFLTFWSDWLRAFLATPSETPHPKSTILPLAWARQRANAPSAPTEEHGQQS